MAGCGAMLVVAAAVCGPAAADAPSAPATVAEPGKLEPLPPAPLLLERVLESLFEAAPDRELLDEIKQRLTDRNRGAAEAAQALQHRQFVRQQAQQFEQFLQPLLRVELTLVRHACGSLPAEARREVLASARQAVRELAERVARRQIEGQGHTPPVDVRLALHEQVAAALEPRATPEEFAAYQRESRQRQERRAEAARLRIVAKLDQQLGLTADQRRAVLEDLRTHWEADWIRELENHDGMMINDRPPAPDFAAVRIMPHLDPLQRTQWTEWSKAAGWDAAPRGGIDWSDLNSLQQSPQKIDAWWRP
jgi:hypothetical protein